jgi:hypothetical protein
MARKPRLDLDGFYHIDISSALVSYVLGVVMISGLLPDPKVHDRGNSSCSIN